jgi:outer membrane protein assembly factor BamB
MTASGLGPRASGALIAVVVLVAACGPKPVFSLSSSTDNDVAALSSALSRRHLPEAPAPLNASHQPRAYVVATSATGGRELVSYDLAGGKLLWQVPAEVQTRVEVGGDFVVATEGGMLVARDQRNGAVRWKVAAPGTFLGAAADAERAYASWKVGSSWRLVAYDGRSGAELWSAPADGQLGAPAAQGGLVYAPYFAQWLTILDGATGASLARLRGLQDQISMLRVTSQTAYYGSARGAFVLDVRSAGGRRDSGTFAQVKVPAQLDRASYGPDVYDPVQLGYSAADRARVLWQADFAPGPEGKMQLAGGGYAVHYFRFVFGFDAGGELRWAYSQPRNELVATAHTGFVLVGVSTTGDIVALEPQTGAVRARATIGGNAAHVLGATFDADGWSPSSQDEPIETVAALVGITRDHDARFDRIKELAVAALGKLPGAEVTTQLLAVLDDPRAPAKLKDDVVALLIARHDPASLPVLTNQLAVHTDYLTGAEPTALAAVAKAIGGLANTAVDARQLAAALAALQTHLDAPATAVPDLIVVIDAMAALGKGAEHPALWSHLLLYHADDQVGGDAAWDAAIVHALFDHGSAGEHELLRQVAADRRTRPSLVAAIHDALGA